MMPPITWSPGQDICSPICEEVDNVAINVIIAISTVPMLRGGL